MNIAIFSPNKNQYSETFIQAHKKMLKGKVFFYYGEGFQQLENHNRLIHSVERLCIRIYSFLAKKPSDFVDNYCLYQSLKKNKIDSILIEFGTSAYRLRSLLKRLKQPIVVHFHGYDASVAKTIEQCDNYREVFYLATKVIAVSKVMEQKLLEIGCPKEKLLLNTYGPQPEFLKVEAKFSNNQFIGIGRFTDKKAPYYLVLAFKEVVKQYKDYKLFIAGNGELYNTVKNLISYYNLENNIILLDIITPKDYQKFLSESLAFVQHSITSLNGDMEGTPLAVLEASAAGLPVISTVHAGIPDVIIDEKTGLLCQEHDVKGMARNMIRLIEDKELAIQMGKAGKENIINNFNLEKHIKIIQKALENK